MAPNTELKRKRGPSEVVDAANGGGAGGRASKRRKSVKNQEGDMRKRGKGKEEGKVKQEDKRSEPKSGKDKTPKNPHDRDAIVPPTKKSFGQDFRKGNRGVVNGGKQQSRKPVENDMTGGKTYLERRKERFRVRAYAPIESVERWKLSEPIGGRMVNADPVFSADEKYLILANRATINVYSTSNSLLIRSTKLKLDLATTPNVRIITYCLSPSRNNIVWVACSDGGIYSIDWTTGAGADQCWYISSQGCDYMTVASMESDRRRRDMVFTAEPMRERGWRMTAHELAPPDGEAETISTTIYTSKSRINIVKTAMEGSIIVTVAGKSVIVGRLRKAFSTVGKMNYEFRVFQSADYVSSLDIRISPRINSDIRGQDLPDVTLVLGDVKGSIFVHNDILKILTAGNRQGSGDVVLPRKLHWHRQAVHTVKFSQDGKYIISGGTETVLVLWQIDTGNKQFLPHMAATIQNVVVSPSGSSYGIQLGDNSAMVLSTAELEPTANVAGVQACVIGMENSPDTQVERLQGDVYWPPVVQRTPAAISPTDPTKLLLGVGQQQAIDPKKPAVVNAPFLQTYDLGSGHNISRQSLARSNVTNLNVTPSALPVSEPRITHLQMSYDGKWLATLDHWIPPVKDLEHLYVPGLDLEIERQRRREVFLKFWQWHDKSKTWALVSRIDAPHGLEGEFSGAGKVTDLVADPTDIRFATIGEDNVVRTWTTRTRKRDGIVVRDEDGNDFRNWACQHATPLCKSELPDSPTSSPLDFHGCLAFSEDSSVLAAATTSSPSTIYLLDTYTSTVSHTIASSTPVIKLGFLSQYLIILSTTTLTVHNLVSQTMHYGFTLSPALTTLTHLQKTSMFHLAISPTSQTLAIALPSASFSKLGKPTPWKDRGSVKEPTLQDQASELYVFGLDSYLPLLQRKMSTFITALLPSTGTNGFVLLDAAAEICTVMKKGGMGITGTARSVSALRLEGISDKVHGAIVDEQTHEDEDEDMDDLEEEALKKANDEDQEEEEEETRNGQEKVVTKEELAAVFDIGPAFALPSVEELFYRVVGLWDVKGEGGGS